MIFTLFNNRSNFSKSYYVVILEFPLVDLLQQSVNRIQGRVATNAIDNNYTYNYFFLIKFMHG